MKKIFLFLILSLFVNFLNGQFVERQVIASGGGFTTTSEWSLSFTIGELAIAPFETNDLILLQGFQQGESAQPTSIQNPAKLRFSVYPNPTTGQVQVSWSEMMKTSLKISILNAEGRRIQQQTVPDAATRWALDLSKLPDGSYFILLENGFGERGVVPVVKQ